MNGEVLIVDEHTGRMLAGRRYNEGMHQAIEAKEGVEIKAENQTLATITLQNYFRLYDKLSGMTGTAETEAAEFTQIYKLGVVADPDQPADDPHRPGRPRLQDRGRRSSTRSSRTSSSATQTGQPVLVGTTSVEKSEYLSDQLRQQRRQARGPQRQAPRARGGDRRPGRPQGRRHRRHQHGRPRHRHHARRQRRVPRRRRAASSAGSTRTRRRRSTRPRGPRRSTPPRRPWPAEHDEVVELGGLYVLGTERHESRRIDNQLRGRSGRQGDPGESRFYLSLQDDLMRLFNAGMVDRFMTTAKHRGRRADRVQDGLARDPVARRPRSRRATPRSARTS